MPPTAMAAAGAGSSCTFCALIGSDRRRRALRVWSGSGRAGHLEPLPLRARDLLVRPKRHVRELDELDEAEASELWAALGRRWRP